ncbi:type II toxin-antitoxin system death-on-curing family toxin [Williamsoniiplasma luminosum]|uniref:Fido domain-containing protein n=1 Tax=Williamsoniiplasma luminosum TaxID=214888 RepID=A0A2S0NJZ3_9MOLU|nr:type II toxin-antitoxin system death-on-curing family toxin [Williamsoniiplasma luminosum]AVP49337.1 MAG: hypothetical protein C5T88_01945 [Williamsoniiplasma luminosum]
MSSKYRRAIFSEKDLLIFKEIYTTTPNLNIQSNCKNIEWTIENPPNFIHKRRFGVENISIELRILKFNEDFRDVLMIIIESAHKSAQMIRDVAGNYGEVSKGAVSATVDSLVVSWSYKYDEGKLTILDVLAELVYALACRHKFKDGNKRTALMTRMFLIQFFGLYVKKGTPEKDTFWDDFIVDIVERHSMIDEELHLKEIKEKWKKELYIWFKRYN